MEHFKKTKKNLWQGNALAIPLLLQTSIGNGNRLKSGGPVCLACDLGPSKYDRLSNSLSNCYLLFQAALVTLLTNYELSFNEPKCQSTRGKEMSIVKFF